MFRQTMNSALLALTAITTAQAVELKFEIHAIDAHGIGPSLGAISVGELAQGVIFTPDLAGLPPGLHGFHVHEKENCGAGEKDGKTVAGLAAGGHYDPKSTGKHAGPNGDGHLGDLPVLSVKPDGTARESVTAPRLSLADLRGRALVIHSESDNYADQPGGARIACGVGG